MYIETAQQSTLCKLKCLELAIAKIIPISLPEKPHHLRHVQNTGETKENKEQNVQTCQRRC